MGVPLIVCAPGVPGGAVQRTDVSLVDLVPTFLSAAGLPLSGCLDGRPPYIDYDTGRPTRGVARQYA